MPLRWLCFLFSNVNIIKCWTGTDIREFSSCTIGYLCNDALHDILETGCRRARITAHFFRLSSWVLSRVSERSTCVRGSVTERRGRAWRLGAGRALRLHVLASFSLAALNLSCFSIPPPHSLAHWAFFQMLTLCRFPAVQLKPQISRSLFLPGASDLRLFTATMPERLV